MATNSMNPQTWLRNQLENADTDLLRQMVRTFADQLMGAEADALCGAGYGERSDERVNSRNGYRERSWDTRAATMTRAIPKLREGSYFPDWLLEPRRRAERALVAVIAECYVRGVSTRRVDGLVKTLGIESMSKSQVSTLGQEPRRDRRELPQRSPRRRPLRLRDAGRAHPALPRGRPHRQRPRAPRCRCQRRRLP